MEKTGSLMHSSTRHISAVAGVSALSSRSDRSFPRHAHDDFGIGYMLAGGHESWSCRGLVEVETGNVITIGPGELHDGLGRSGEPRTWNMLRFSLEAVADLTDQKPDELEFCAPVLNDPANSALVRAAIETSLMPGVDPSDLEQILRLTLGRVLRARKPEQEEVRAPDSVQRIIEQIHSAWAEPLTLNDFAKTASMDKYQTVRSFAREVGATPYAYLLQYRLNRARELMSSGAQSGGNSDCERLLRPEPHDPGVHETVRHVTAPLFEGLLNPQSECCNKRSSTLFRVQ